MFWEFATRNCLKGKALLILGKLVQLSPLVRLRARY